MLIKKNRNFFLSGVKLRYKYLNSYPCFRLLYFLFFHALQKSYSLKSNTKVCSCCKIFLLVTIISVAFNSCKQHSSDNLLFQKLDASQTHIQFANNLSYNDKFNIYTY